MKVSREFLINTACIAFLAGISLISWIIGTSLFGVLIPLALIFWIWQFRRNFGRKQSLVLIIFILFGALRMELAIFDWANNNFARPVGGHSGMAVGFPDISGLDQHVDLDVAGKKVQIKLSALLRLLPGDKVDFWGELVSADNQIWHIQQKENWFKDGVNAVVKNLGEVRTSDGSAGILRSLFELRIWLGELLSKSLNEPAASLITGILIGDKGNLSDHILADFQKTGLTHILAISGFNITLVINLILFFFAGVNENFKLLLCILMIGFFILLTGAGASVLRAGVMGILVLAVKTSGRRIKPLKLILLSTVVIVWFSPGILDFDLSFQLSLAATASIIYFAEFFEREVEGWKKWVAEGIGLTLAAQVLTLPITFTGFGKISLISPLANLLIVPFVPILMFLGAAQILLQVFLPFLAFLLSGLIGLMVSLMFWIIHTLANLPLAQIEFGQGETVWAIIYYWLVFRLFRRHKLDQVQHLEYALRYG